MRYANITSSLALFIALGGTGYAALKLPKNSVHAKQIAAGAVCLVENEGGNDLRILAAPSRILSG